MPFSSTIYQQKNLLHFTSLTVNGAPDNNTPLNVITQCAYANGAGYRFTYGDWGIINKIENLSAPDQNGVTHVRNYVSYNYPLASAGALTDAPSYTQEIVSPDGLDTNTSIWNNSVTKLSTGVVTSMAVTDPLGNKTTSTLDQSTGLLSQVQFADGYQYSAQGHRLYLDHIWKWHPSQQDHHCE